MKKILRNLKEFENCYFRIENHKNKIHILKTITILKNHTKVTPALTNKENVIISFSLST